MLQDFWCVSGCFVALWEIEFIIFFKTIFVIIRCLVIRPLVFYRLPASYLIKYIFDLCNLNTFSLFHLRNKKKLKLISTKQMHQNNVNFFIIGTLKIFVLNVNHISVMVVMVSWKKLLVLMMLLLFMLREVFTEFTFGIWAKMMKWAFYIYIFYCI